MATTDIRIPEGDRALLASMIGKTFDRFYYDEFFGGSAKSCNTCEYSWIVVDAEPYDLHCELEPLCYYGSLEDVATVHVRDGAPQGIRSGLVNTRLIAVEIGRTIEDVRVFDDTESLAAGGVAEPVLARTSAIVFDLEGTEVAFTFMPWLSEDTHIEYGPRAAKGVPDAIEDVARGDRDHITASRTVTSLKEWAKTRGNA